MFSARRTSNPRADPGKTRRGCASTEGKAEKKKESHGRPEAMEMAICDEKKRGEQSRSTEEPMKRAPNRGREREREREKSL